MSTKSTQVVVVSDKKVRCDGNEVSSGHPLVYLNMGEKDNIDCPYCGCKFTLKKSK